ncbi:hypothetical protein BJ165DRAFT_633214 [Panaeolus papilionaceus]|nr:hypothetical protein BJ165DRAFT_633214 [Panaeolus papilionaceus]
MPGHPPLISKTSCRALQNRDLAQSQMDVMRIPYYHARQPPPPLLLSRATRRGQGLGVSPASRHCLTRAHLRVCQARLSLLVPVGRGGSARAVDQARAGKAGLIMGLGFLETRRAVNESGPCRMRSLKGAILGRLSRGGMSWRIWVVIVILVWIYTLLCRMDLAFFHYFMQLTVSIDTLCCDTVYCRLIQSSYPKARLVPQLLL